MLEKTKKTEFNDLKELCSGLNYRSQMRYDAMVTMARKVCASFS